MKLSSNLKSKKSPINNNQNFFNAQCASLREAKLCRTHNMCYSRIFYVMIILLNKYLDNDYIKQFISFILSKIIYLFFVY